MIECISRKFYKAVNKKCLYFGQFVLDTEADAANLPESAPGSYAVVADGSKRYMVNASGVWVECSGSSGGSGVYPFCEGVQF